MWTHFCTMSQTRGPLLRILAPIEDIQADAALFEAQFRIHRSDHPGIYSIPICGEIEVKEETTKRLFAEGSYSYFVKVRSHKVCCLPHAGFSRSDEDPLCFNACKHDWMWH